MEEERRRSPVKLLWISLAGVLLAIVSAAPPAVADRAEVAAALERACPCAGPAWGGSWASARRYRACVRRELRSLVREDGLSALQAARAFRRARRSSCGRPPELADPLPGEAEVRLCTSGGALACTPLGRVHADSCEECDAALDGRLVGCARYRELDGAESSICGGPLPRRRGTARRIDRRSAPDCARCLAELGTERPEGVECSRWSCGPL